MENASKALLMAGGILIALLIISALYLMFSNLAGYNNKSDTAKKASQIAEFNNQFEPYNKDNLTLMELKSIYNKIESNNTSNPEKKIVHNINDILRSSYSEIESNFKNDFSKVDGKYKQYCVFKCTTVEYDSSGFINKMIFSDKTSPEKLR